MTGAALAAVSLVRLEIVARHACRVVEISGFPSLPSKNLRFVATAAAEAKVTLLSFSLGLTEPVRKGAAEGAFFPLARPAGLYSTLSTTRPRVRPNRRAGIIPVGPQLRGATGC
jgi:hypothetical protein